MTTTTMTHGSSGSAAGPILLCVPEQSGRFALKTVACSALLLVFSSTTAHATAVGAVRMDSGTTGVSLVARQQEVDVSSSAALAEIRRRANLTWNQLASLLAVSARTLHSWAKDNVELRGRHASRLAQLLEQTRALSHLPVFKLRATLLATEHSHAEATLPFDREPAILMSDATPFEHQVNVRPRKTRIRRG
jgi:DNA-binding transcriptional regulator YiaG